MNLGNGYKADQLCNYARCSDWSNVLGYYNAIVRAI
jgi:hypothetical protein